MEAEQYQRDIARIEAHKLALQDDGFRNLVNLVQREIYERTNFLQRRGALITLQPGGWSVANADGKRVAMFTPKALSFQIDAKGAGVDYSFKIEVEHNSPVILMSKWGTAQGKVDEYTVREAIHNVIDSITDLTRPIV